jgi:hypothetical protein
MEYVKWRKVCQDQTESNQPPSPGESTPKVFSLDHLSLFLNLSAKPAGSKPRAMNQAPGFANRRKLCITSTTFVIWWSRTICVDDIGIWHGTDASLML